MSTYMGTSTIYCDCHNQSAADKLFMSAADITRNRRNIILLLCVRVGAKRGHRLFRRQGPKHLDR